MLALRNSYCYGTWQHSLLVPLRRGLRPRAGCEDVAATLDDAEVRVVTDSDSSGRATAWRSAEPGEKGELVITQPWPYLARTIWGDADRLGDPEWRGDLKRFREVYFDRWQGELAYTQGDYARRHDDEAVTLHGRSDDVINVSGHRVGTEEIEGAILRDKTLREDSPLGNAVVVGAPHDEKGETPVAFLIPAPGRKLADDDLARLAQLVRSEKGATAVLIFWSFRPFRNTVGQVHAADATGHLARRGAR